MSNGSTALTNRQREQLNSIQTLLTSRKDQLQSLAPAGVSAEQICKVAIFEASKNEYLLGCNPASSTFTMYS